MASWMSLSRVSCHTRATRRATLTLPVTFRKLLLGQRVQVAGDLAPDWSLLDIPPRPTGQKDMPEHEQQEPAGLRSVFDHSLSQARLRVTAVPLNRGDEAVGVDEADDQ